MESLGLNASTCAQDDVIKLKHFPRYWRSLVNSPHKGQWRGALLFSLFFFVVSLCFNKRSCKQSSRRRFETLSRSLWRHCNTMSWYFAKSRPPFSNMPSDWKRFRNHQSAQYLWSVISNDVISAVPGDGLAPLDARPCAGTVMTRCLISYSHKTHTCIVNSSITFIIEMMTWWRYLISENICVRDIVPPDMGDPWWWPGPYLHVIRPLSTGYRLKVITTKWTKDLSQISVRIRHMDTKPSYKCVCVWRYQNIL